MSDIKKTYFEEDDNKSLIIDINENVVGLNQYNALNELVTHELNDGVKAIVFDMSGLNTINSSGLGILISCLKTINNSNCSLKIINANKKILDIFKLTKLTSVFKFENAS